MTAVTHPINKSKKIVIIKCKNIHKAMTAVTATLIVFILPHNIHFYVQV